MSTPVSEGFKAQILLTLFEINKLEKRRKAIHEELESIAKSAASFVGVDLKTHILDVDTLEFIERNDPPAPPEVQAAPEPKPEEVMPVS